MIDEYFSDGTGVYATYDDGSEKFVMFCEGEQHAAEMATKLNAKLQEKYDANN